MFARSVSFHLKPGRAGEFTRLLDQDVIPVLRKQKGFQDEISLVAAGGAEAVGISVWDLKEDAETYARERVCRCAEGTGARWWRARLRCRRMRCPTRPFTRSLLARVPEADTSVRPMGRPRPPREFGGEVPPQLYDAGEENHHDYCSLGCVP